VRRTFLKGETSCKCNTGEPQSAFDSSYDLGRPFEFMIGNGEVIKGWVEGCVDCLSSWKIIRKLICEKHASAPLMQLSRCSPMMKIRLLENSTLMFTSDDGYGSQGVGSLPPNADLIFEVKLLKIGEKEANIQL
jgi:hypothetical protein